MADEGKVVIELVGKDSATQTFVKSFQDMQASFQRLEASGSRSATSLGAIEKNAMQAGNAVGSLASNLLTLAGLSYIGYRLSQGFVEAIKSIDTYKTQIIQIAATLTSLSEKGQGPIDEQLGRNLAYAEQMYRAINLESAKHFASANEGMKVYNQLVQKGYGVRLDEVNALLQVTDLIKLNTAGQNVEIQLNQEIRALMDGQAKATSALAMALKNQLGPDWNKLVDKHKEAGDLLQWIASLYPGLGAASEKVQDTWTAQYATAQSLLQLLSIGGLGGAYEDIVNYLKKANEYLRTHGDELEGRIQNAWGNIKPLVFGISDAMVKIANAGLQFAQDMDRIASNPALMALFGAALGSRAGVWGAVAGAVAGGAYPAAKSLAAGAGPGGDFGFGGVPATSSGLLGYGTESEGYVSGLPDATPTKLRKPPAAAGDKARKGVEAAADRVRSIMDTLDKKVADLAGDSTASIDAWTAKMLNDLDKQAAKGAEVADAQVKVWFVSAAMRQKNDEKFDKWWFGASNDRVSAARLEGESLKKSYGDTAAHRQKIEEYTANKIYLIWNSMESERLKLTKGYLDQLSAASPLISEQLALKGEALKIELELADLALDKQLAEGKITQDIYDQAKAMQALVAQAKRYALEREKWQTQGWQGGMKMATLSAENTAKTWEANTVSSLLTSLPKTAASTMANAFVNALQGKKTDLEALSYSMAEKLIETQLEGMLTKIWPESLKALMQWLGIKYASETSAAAETGATLITAGQICGANILAYAEAAAAVLSGSGGGGGGGGGGLSGLLSGLFSSGGEEGIGSGAEAASDVFGYIAEIVSAHGNIFGPMGVIPFGQGGVVNRPTLFPFASGIGLMGEKGAEAILPLTRLAGGDLGVKSSGGGNTTWNIKIVNSTKTPVTAQAQKGSGDRDLIIYIDELVRNLIDGSGQAAQSVNRRTGTSPPTVVR